MKTTMTVEEIIEDLRKRIKEWPEEEQTTFFLTEYTSDRLIQYHHTLGLWIRNNYNLWQIPWEPELEDGVDYSPYHPDQVSFTIMKEAWKRGPLP